MDLVKLNVDLCRALGVTDLKDVACVTLQIRANEVPLVTVERAVLKQDAVDGLQTAVEVLHLHLVPAEPPLPI